MHALREDSQLLPADKLRAALTSVLALSRRQPYLYQLMFTTPEGDPTAVVRAAQRMCDEFLGVVAAVVGEQNAQRYAAMLLTHAHGAAGLESSGLLRTDKWQTSADELIDTALAMVADANRRD